MSRILSFGLYVMGVCFIGMTVLMTAAWGKSMALSDFNGLVLAASSVGVDVMVVMMAATAGVCWSNKRKGLTVLALAAAIIFATYSVLGIVGFGAGERIAKSRLAEDTYVAQQRLVEKTNAVAIELAKEHARWARETYVDSRNVNEKTRLIGESKITVPDLKADAVAPMADGQAQVIAELTGLPMHGVQLGMAIALSFLLPSGKILCFLFAPIAWAARKKTEANVEHTPAPASQPSATTKLTPTNVVPLNPPKSIDMDKDRALAMLAGFLAAEVEPSPGDNVRAKHLYDAYRLYAQSKGAKVLSMDLFREGCIALGLQHLRLADGRAEYKDRRIVSSSPRRVAGRIVAA
jgi:hypothetical protein